MNIDIPARVAAHGGVMHREALARVGASRYAIQQAITANEVIRVGRDRVALATCDPQLLRATRWGARLTCISAARLLGLWVLDDERVHVSLPPGGKNRDRAPGLRAHWSRGVVAAHRTDCVEPIQNILAHIATCQPLESAVAAFDSAIRLGRTSIGELERLASRTTTAFSCVVRECDGGADSGIESIVRVRLAGRDIRMRIQVVIDGHPVDGLIGRHLVIQCDGYGPHSNRWQRNRDLEQDARLTLQGYTVLRFSYDQIVSDWPRVEATILAAMAAGLHL